MTLSKDVIVLGNWREKRRGEGEEHRGGERRREGRKRRGERRREGRKEEEGRWRARDSGHMSGDVERFSLFSQY